jgi:tRNA A37 threonylcarbamoyladenosine modification protein TsaB
MILWIDTSSDAPFIAFNETLVFLKRAKNLVSDLKILVPDPEAIKEIRVGCGPGFFTGTRIGVMVAKSLHFALNVPMFGFSSLMIHPPLEEGPFLTYTDAKNRGFYVLKGTLKNSVLSYESPLLLPELPRDLPPLMSLPTIEHLKNIPYSPKIEVVY